MSVTQSFEESLTFLNKNNESCDTPISSQRRINWKVEMRKMVLTKLPIKKASPRLCESSKSKNIPKNISKVITQQILRGYYNHLIQCNQKTFLSFIKKNKNIQNLTTLLKLIKPHKNTEVNSMHECFRNICWYFLKKQYVSYVFNSKIKDPQWHIQYRNALLKICRDF
ncbi:unnamed protein product [Paramecium primaurelia]|uniref:Uncharacterized protein n=1 Tax=Paramecium primaurelia TaxID=5886 RepID=A0A8S1PP60_PARPR|nr:unnamed protein product [Paramecium primaurelia]